MEDAFADIRNDLQKVEAQIVDLRRELRETQQEIKEAELRLEQTTDAEEKADIRAKLQSLRKREEGLNAQLVKLQGQAEAFAGQLQQRERRLALASEAKRQKTLPLTELPNGSSHKFYEALHRLGDVLSLPDTVDELQTSVRDIDMPPLFVLSTIYATLLEEGLLAVDEFKWVQAAADDAEAAVLISNDIHHVVIHNASVEDSEDTMHSPVDAVLASTCKRAFRGRRRNQSETSSAGRPDFFVPVHVSAKTIVAFRGEDKLFSRVDNSHPRDELIEKTPWDAWEQFYRDLPYIFGYFAIGRPEELLLQFGCLVRDSQTFVPIGQEYNLAAATDRVHAFLFFVKLVPFLRAAAKRASGAPLDILWESDRGDGVTLRYVVIDGVTRTQKKYQVGTFKQLEQLHRVWSSRSEFFASIEQSENYFVPILHVGTHSKPAEYAVAVHFARCDPVRVNLANVLTAIYHTIEALEVLHAHNCVHNDIRWPNVMFSTAARRYVLIDFDDSARLEEDGRVPPVGRLLDSDSHAPNIRERHGPEVDVWGVGYMMMKQSCAPWLTQLGLQIVGPGAEIPALAELKQELITCMAQRNIELPREASNT